MPRAIPKTFHVPSPALAKIVGPDPIARTEVVAKLWIYIKDKGLQGAKDRRLIIADADLAAVFGKPSATMFEMNRLITSHLT